MNKEKLSKLLKIDEKRGEAREIEQEMSGPGFWSDQDNSTRMSQRLTYLNNIIKSFDTAKTEEEIKYLETEAMFSDDLDGNPAIISVHAGAGGTEAQDWAEMLLRMFLRFAEKKGFKAEILGE